MHTTKGVGAKQEIIIGAEEEDEDRKRRHRESSSATRKERLQEEEEIFIIIIMTRRKRKRKKKRQNSDQAEEEDAKWKNDTRARWGELRTRKSRSRGRVFNTHEQKQKKGYFSKSLADAGKPHEEGRRHTENYGCGPISIDPHISI